jgi:signal peptidase II
MSVIARYGRFGLHGLVSGAIVLLDQWTKALVLQRMTLHESIEIIPSLFNLTYIRNPGAAFGLFVQMSERFRLVFFPSVTILVTLVLLHLFIKSIQDDYHDGAWRPHPHHRWLRISVAMVIGGAIGNLIDRLRYGEVIDFLDFYIGRYHWPAFNVADSCITVGIPLLFLTLLLAPPAAAAPQKE